MRLIILAAALTFTVPAQAGLLSGAGLINVAKVVLNNRAVLNKGAAQCPSEVALQPQDNLLMTAAGSAVQSALPVGRFGALESAAAVLANRSAKAPDFCRTTAAKKPGLLGGIADAARKLGVGGGLLGGRSAPGTSDNGSGGALGGLGSILGGSLQPGKSTSP